MKSFITSIMLTAVITLGSFIPLESFMISSAHASDYKKMNCLYKGHHWSKGVCYKRKKKSSSAPSSKQIKGDSDEYYYKRSSAMDRAQTEIMNRTAEYCGSSSKSRITWHDRDTTCKKRNSQYRCKVYATANCLSESCGKRFCGTKR